MNIKRFNETNINLKELDAPVADNQVRGQKLVARLKNQQSFTVSPDGKSEKDVSFDNDQTVADNITDQNDKYDRDDAQRYLMKGKRYTPVFKGNDGKDYKLNDIKKDEYFGRSSGSSLGYEETKRVESIQCLFLALRQSIRRDITREDISYPGPFYDNVGDIKKAEILDYVSISIAIDGNGLRQFIDEDKKRWVESMINTSNALYEIDLQLVGKNKRTVFKPNKKYVFHHIGSGSEMMNAITSAYYDCPESKNIPISKWTPSDIWAVDSNPQKASETVSKINFTDNIKDLNEIIDYRFRVGQLVGISLKKTGGSEKLQLVINKITPHPSYHFSKFITSQDSLGSKGITLVSTYESELVEGGDQKLALRSFSGDNSLSDISGELIGTKSQYGKIGLSWINRILKHNGISGVITKNEIESDKDFYTNDYLKQEIGVLNNMITDKRRETDKRISNRSGMISKFQCLKLAEIFRSIIGVKMSDHSAEWVIENPKHGDLLLIDKVVTEIFYYALAIENLQFECPIYIRVVTTN